MHGIPHWSISIALQAKGRIEAGVVYDPIKDEMFYAERGSGAFHRRQRLRVSGRINMETACIAYGKPPSNNKSDHAQFMNEVSAVSSLSPMTRRMGSAALDLAYVAAGRLDGYWERGPHPWDLAAGYLLVKEAGGFITSIDNREDPVFNRQVLSGNEAVYNTLNKILKHKE